MKRLLRLGGRLLRGLAILALGVLAAALVAVVVLAIRLAQGPMDVAWAVRAGLSLAGAREVHIGSATLAWDGWHDGAESPIRLNIGRLDVTGADGVPSLSAAEGEATLSASALLAGQILPATAGLRGAHLRARRDAAGAWHLALAGADAQAGPTRQAGSSRQGDTGDALLSLRRLSLQDATVEVDDARLGPWRLQSVQADLVRDDDGALHGTASADAVLADNSTHVAVRAAVEPGGASRIEAEVGPLDPAPLLTALGLAAGTSLAAPVSVAATLTLDHAFQPQAATATATAGPGQATFAGGTVAFASLSASVDAGWTGGTLDRVTQARLEAVVASPSGGSPSRLGLDGIGIRQGDHLVATVKGTLDQVRLDDVAALWPPQAAPHAREWIAGNIKAGTLHEAGFSVTLDTPADFSDVAVTAAQGRMRAVDGTVHWLRPVPPVEHVTATITMAAPDAIDIVVDPAATQPVEATAAGPLVLRAGTIRLTGLTGDDQFAAIDLDIAGSLPATLALLRHPRLRLLSTHPVPFKTASGTSAVRLGLKLPLKRDVSFDDVPVRVDARMTRLRLGGIVAGKDLTDGDVRMQVTNDGMTVDGRAAVAGIPGALGVMLDFRHGPPSQVMQSVTFSARPGPAQLAGAGLPVAGVLTGTPAVAVSYSSRRDGQGEVSAHVDLTAAGVDVLGWRKPPGPAARLDAHAVLDHDRLQAVDVLEAEGPGLSLHGQAELAAGRPAALVIDRAEIGRTRASGRVGFGRPLTVSATGPVLDASSLLKGGAASRGSARPGGGPGTPFVADIAFQQVLLGPGRALTGVAAHAESDGRTLRRAFLGVAGPARLTASVEPDARGRTLVARAAEVGTVLRLLDVTDRIETGPATVNGRWDGTGPDAPLLATLAVERLHILGAPAVGKVLQAITVYGILDALRGPGLTFARLDVPFRYAGDRLDLLDARLTSASLGATASGRVDLGRETVDVRGTIVPAYLLNSAPGRIPLIGRLFTAEEGGGLLAAGYAVRGPLDDPSVSVNPFTLLAPGLLRRLFAPRLSERPAP